ncbi:hypothetical protein FQA39_LY15287 [Lamprigera yunnana]|nr:hypothetical protein FQA39_LY15287 [Lamprigera yunnana]
MASSASTVSGGKHLLHRRKSCDTVCSSNSSCLMQKRKSVHPLAASICSYLPRNNAVQQRVLSARLLKLRSLQSKLNDANFHLAELQKENRALRNLQTRQDKALSKYEGTNADLPKLLKTYEEDIRMLTTKNKTLRKSVKESNEQLKTKDEEIMGVREQLKNLMALTKNKNLGERHMLSEQVDDLKDQLKSRDDRINMLNRKILLEEKNYKSKLNGEIIKNKQRQKELAQALAEIDRLNCLLVEGRGKLPPKELTRFSAGNHQSSSLTNLVADKVKPKINANTNTNTNKIKENENNNVTETISVKLEPIVNLDKNVTFSRETVMSPPSDSIKARLSTNLTKQIDKLNKSVAELGLEQDEPDVSFQKFHTNSGLKLEKLVPDATLNRKLGDIKNDQDISKRLGNYCNEMQSSIKEFNSINEQHKQDYKQTQNETEALIRTLQETDDLNAKLRYTNFLSADKIDIPQNDLEIANEIWNNEYNFRKESRTSNAPKSFLKSETNGNVVKKEAIIEQDKLKLLAALRAIDNENDGNSVLQSTSHKLNHSIDEYFNSVN